MHEMVREELEGLNDGERVLGLVEMLWALST